MGYNNTKAIEAFNLAEENASWKVEAVEYVVDYRTKVPAPETSNGAAFIIAHPLLIMVKTKRMNIMHITIILACHLLLSAQEACWLVKI